MAASSFCTDLWASVQAQSIQAITLHPFLAGLIDGSLNEAVFRCVAQACNVEFKLA